MIFLKMCKYLHFQFFLNNRQKIGNKQTNFFSDPNKVPVSFLELDHKEKNNVFFIFMP